VIPSAAAQDERARLRRDDDSATQRAVGREGLHGNSERAGEGDATAADEVATGFRARERLPIEERDT
jgi:hypothetical protein